MGSTRTLVPQALCHSSHLGLGMTQADAAFWLLWAAGSGNGPSLGTGTRWEGLWFRSWRCVRADRGKENSSHCVHSTHLHLPEGQTGPSARLRQKALKWEPSLVNVVTQRDPVSKRKTQLEDGSCGPHSTGARVSIHRGKGADEVVTRAALLGHGEGDRE